MDRICVLIRVYNRVEDLAYCINIIKDTWKSFNYYILVVANGLNDGYILDAVTRQKIDKLIELTNNIGHFNGNSQLLIAGASAIPDDCKYTIILEADTWLYQDGIVVKYIKEMDQRGAVWASAQFFRYVLNLATDFAIIKSSFIKEHTEIFSFSGTPEYHVANYLHKRGFKFIYITENMPVSLPKYFRKYPYASKGRFFAFEKSKMVTHHIENLRGGMDEKKYFFNLVAQKKYFGVKIPRSYRVDILLMRFFVGLSGLLPYKGWLIKSKKI